MQPHRINVPLVAKREVIHLLSYMSHLKLMQYEYMLILPLLINITVISSRVHSQRSCHTLNSTGKRDLRKGSRLMLKSSQGPFINHNLNHVKPLHPRHIIRQHQKLTKLERRNTNANGRLQIVVQNPRAKTSNS